MEINFQSLREKNELYIPTKILKEDVELHDFINSIHSIGIFTQDYIPQGITSLKVGRISDSKLKNLVDYLSKTDYYFNETDLYTTISPKVTVINGEGYHISPIINKLPLIENRPYIIKIVTNKKDHFDWLPSGFNYVLFTAMHRLISEPSITGVKYDDKEFFFIEETTPLAPQYLSSLYRNKECEPQISRIFWGTFYEDLYRSVFFNYQLEETVNGYGFSSNLSDVKFWTKVVFPLLENAEVSPMKPINLPSTEEGEKSWQRLEIAKSFLKSCYDLREENNNLLESIKNYQHNIGANQITINSNNTMIGGVIQKLNSGYVDEVIQSFIDIRRLPYVTDITPKQDGIEVKTTPIRVDDIADLGGYTIYLDSKRVKIAITNDENPINGYAHPHVQQGDEACFGNWSDIYEHLATGEYYVVIEMLHEFLSSYNMEDDWGRHIFWWNAEAAIKAFVDADVKWNIPREYDNIYYDLYEEHLVDVETCSYCGEVYDECTCTFCERCDERIEDCNCERCPDCNELIEPHYMNCECNRCDECGELVEDCTCPDEEDDE